MGFLHGVERLPPPSLLPLTISAREADPSLLVFDDLNAGARCHVCAIPADVYVPDLRDLFVVPEEGLALVRRLSDGAWRAVERCFLADDAWATKALSPTARALSNAALRSHAVAGFNLPPSQYQLHLQLLLPPLLPQHYALFRAGK